ncbi:Ubiquitin carboxyl-terminal hydrolase [Mycena indigotica]|uniref:Ubiquitin carboxyl-terminal hydrolase n=1 Tax=Mycena indigotica TaxID=2126181 RepID=A0A8H6S5I2_9AGAR|nr:Ubiquitin carboxyl-terminal hydrolase [Mycena indigotica]KAF7292718.1 Ubiquitin carboxyl-terminal hydrolase [Mycena indigotica]
MNEHRLHYIPLESDPIIFTELIQALGVHSLQFHDVLSLDLADLSPSGALALPADPYALILIFPTTQEYEADLKAAKKRAHLDGTQYKGCGEQEPVHWFEQTIGNACGLYAILHAVANLGPAASKDHIASGSVLESFLAEVIPFDPEQRAAALETSPAIAEAHRRAAVQGSTPVPDAEDEVYFHYICFVKSPKNGHIYELDGDKNGFVDRDSFLEGDQDLLSGGLKLVQSLIETESQQFQLMALVPTTSPPTELP